MERQLATIQRITSLTPIEGADKIEVASILGWKVVVKKEEFRVNDLVVFCEIDSILPDRPEFEFMRDRKFRVKTIKLRKQISQGICFPLNILPASMSLGISKDIAEGEDVTDILGIKKFEIEIPAQLRGKVKNGRFTDHVPKTDEMRIQSKARVLEELRGLPYYITLKVDGTSFTFAKKDGQFDICSRNLVLLETEDNIYWKMARKYNLFEMPDGYAIQGEIAGPGIQSNRLKLSEPELFVYNVYNINEKRYLDFDDYNSFVKSIGCKQVEVIEFGDSFNYTLDFLLKIAKGNYDSGHPREGIVVRPVTEMYSPTLEGRLSFKVINNDYLLAIGE